MPRQCTTANIFSAVMKRMHHGRNRYLQMFFSALKSEFGAIVE